MNVYPKLLILAVTLIIFGGLLANQIQTNGGTVKVSHVRFAGNNAIISHARLYVPEGISNKNPAPGIIATHGYLNSNETQSGFAIEFARRGYVVLTPDQPGHGYSDPAAFSNGFGGIDTLAYMKTLPFVDKSNIGLEGHSMGGWASLVAAGVHPNDYQSIVILGSSTGSFGAPTGTPDWPRNIAIVFSKYDEFSSLMWGVDLPTDITKTDKLKQLFNRDEEIIADKLYGNVADGTARIFHQPAVTHPGIHFSSIAIGHAIKWFDLTLSGAKSIPATDQIWLWKEVGTFIALLGMIMLIIPTLGKVSATSMFSSLKAAMPKLQSLTGHSWWFGAVIFTALPALTLLPFKGISERLGWQASALFAQNITSQVMIWALLTGLISMLLLLLWHFLLNRKTGASFESYGLTWNGQIKVSSIAHSFLLAFVVVGGLYISLLLTDFLFDVDYRIWVFAIKPLSLMQMGIALSYLMPFSLFFIIVGAVLHGQLRRDDWSFSKELSVNWLLLNLGYLVFLSVQYTPMFMGSTLLIASEPLWSIIVLQFIPLMTIASLVFTVAYRITGRVYTGAFINGIIITWVMVASQATHFA
ncbi:alpha/beta hydrolase family protein [Colwellia hornerae]|uniref:Alpha/beta fold hydrolase n=1 Tax=Colwellia hornerae TaxID=89402 RepID=A0A5C6Q2W7_9GAMM|nr:alpha/beta fold hydrolase [Colwellia hornerae]TWX46996.1 alpha/beta fold hydrolase [Colwellia hornerae]TWX54332.1 alpha/beta fold hydrolase [Colwellia hornerae]TWX63171.1 alpha/beta fold hydrolase [Colwellia hornerae]